MKKYLIGTSGWNYDDWQGKFYPKNLPKTKWLDFYSRTFNTVEVNYSFYHWPNEKTMKKWYQEAPETFKFTLKSPRTITHVRKLKNITQKVKNFYKLTSLLKEKTGCHLYQLPPSFKLNQNNFKKLKNFLKILNKNKDNAIEFRHETWWTDSVYELLKKHKTSFCIVSGLEMPKDIVITSNTAYFRFHGINYSSNYPASTLKKYSKIMKKLKCKKIYAYLNNDTNAYAVKNALTLKKYLS